MFLLKSVETSDLFSVGSRLGPAGLSGAQLECKGVHVEKWACTKLLVHVTQAAWFLFCKVESFRPCAAAAAAAATLSTC